MPTILLIRHGESRANAGEPTSCPHIVELTTMGREQAKAIAQFLQEAQLIPELIVTSSYMRTKQTAVPTKLVFPNVPEKEWPVQEFTYLSSLHEWRSTTWDRRPSVEAYWDLSDPSYVDDPKPGSPIPESFEQFIARVRKVKKQLEQSDLAITALFSHEQFMNAFRWLSQNDPGELSTETMKEFRAFLKANPILNGAIVETKFHKGYTDWRYEMITSHLSERQLVSTKR
jgi:probable phosphoglycerate mutase